LAQIAGALAVELWVTASEESRRKDEKSNASSSIFGIHDDLADHEASEIPHQIRGSLRQFTQTIFQAPPFTNCVACSENVLREYRENGKSFLLSVFNSDKGDVLELASGIRDLLKGLRGHTKYGNGGSGNDHHRAGEDDEDDDDDNDGDIFGACSEEEDF